MFRVNESSDSEVLEALRRRTTQAYAAGDVDQAVDLYVDEAVQQPPGRPAVVGRDAIRQSYGLLFSQGGLALRLSPWETVVSGNEARERGAYHLAMGDRVLLAGKYVFVAREAAAGEWRYVWTTVTPD